jgi:hypothetical protein
MVDDPNVNLPDGTGAINAQSFDFVLPYGEDVSDVE